MHRFVSVLREDHRTLLRRIVLYQINRPYSTKIGSCDNFTRVDNLTEATEPVENPVVNSPNCTEPTTDLEGRCDVNERTISSKNGAHGMSKLLETISKRKKPKAGPTVGVFPKPVGTMLAEIFTSTAKSNTPLEARGRVVPKPRAFVAQGKPVVSSSLISKLRENVLRKQMDWQCVAQSYPSLQRLGVWQKRSEWTNLFLANSAVPLPPASAKRLKNNGGNEPAAILTDFPQPVTDVFVCNAPTGSGKSSLVPLFLLDSHWQRMLQRIDISHKAKIVSSAASSSVIDSKEGVMRSVETFLPPSPFPVNVSTREYATVFGASSRLCIIVSQPTRLACVELAKFTAAILASSSSTPAASNVGDRVGYAVGGDSCFSAASEIIYATPGYILNALQHDHSLLSHTTLIIDEAHCRDMETDLLLAWAKQQLLRAYQREHGKDREQSWGMRHLILMSATLSAEQMVSYLIGAQFSAPPSEATRNLSAFCKPYVLSLGNEAAQPPDEVSDVAVRSGLAGSGPYRLEEYFIDDLPSALESSQLLGADEKSADNGSKGVSSLNGRLCPLLLPPARRVMASLVHFFSYIRFSPEIHSPQARALAQFVLFTLQSIASLASCRSKPHTTEGSGAVQEKGGITQDQNNEQPESILVFLPGFAEMSLVLQSLEVLCRKTLVNDEGTNDTQRHAEPAGATTKISGDSTMNYAYDNAGSGNVTFLEYEGCSFSVALLHATAVGSPQRQLRETTSPFPYRIILSTNVAESSVTIPNVRCVVDSCLERRFFSDPLTGVTLRSTAVVSVSSSRQRAGRAGRTCDSFVIRLAPRRMFTLQKEVVGTHYGNCGQEELVTSDEKGDDGKVKDNRGEDNESGKAFFLTSHQRSLSGLVPAAPAHTIPESAAANVASLLLRVKYLFPHQASSLLLLLPDAPKPKAIAQGIRQLLDLGLLQCSKSPKQRSGDDVHCIGDSCLELSKDMPRLIDLYNDVCLTAKGEFVSYFPIPHEQALMLYYALQFACIEDAILIACAMTVPTLLLYPRVSVQVGDSKSCEGAPAAQYLQSLLIQRSTASKIGERGKSTSGHTLSEPLMLLSILYEWYACTSSADVVAFFRKFRVNGRALRTVDSSVAQCALRLWRLVTQGSDSHETVNKEKAVTSGVGGGDKDDVFALYGEHDRVERRPSASLIKQLVLSTFPESYRVLLANSLLRLHRCALEHSAHRPSSQHRTMTQWYTQDEQLIRKLQPQLPRAPKQNQRSKKPLLTFGHVQDRLCAAFVAAFARNTMRGEDASHRAHQRRMLRNLGALQEDADRTCSFSVELHSDQRHQQSLLERLTPEVLRDVITPYLADTNVQQIELFSTRRSGVVRFGSEVNGSVDGDRRGGNSGKEEDRLLSAVALPCDPAGLTEAEKGRNLAAVVLAPIGISLLVSIQNVLTRLVAMLPPTSPPASSAVRLPGEQDRNDGETESIRRAEAHEKVASLDRSLPVPGIRTVNRTFSLRFTETEGDSSAASDTCVTWHDSYGREHSLLLSDARRMGYEEFFPQPIAAAAADADHEDCSICRSTGNGVILSGEPVPAPGVDEDVSSSGVNSDGSDEQHALLSIHRVTFTGAVQWKVTLPTVRPSQHEYHSCEKEEGETAPCNKDYYCYVCHNLWFREKSFHHHCRSVTHLTRLSFAVQFGMRREWVGSFCSGTLSDLLLRKRGTNSVSSIGCSDVAVELRSCNVSPLSFLNALQWRPRGEGGTAMLPMAVAGTLIGNAPSYTVTRAAPIKDSGMTLQALHVWVLDTERPGASTEPAGSELPPSLFVLAGYLAAASTGFDAALLTNTAHTRAHAVMLHDWGVWRFPTPLSVQKLKSVMRVYAGKPWRGVPVDADDECEAGGTATDQSSESGNRCRKDDAGGACEEESLHWCVVSDVCPQCTYSGSGGKGRQTRRGILKVVLDDDAPSVDEVVQSTLLIVLHEYQNSLRNVVSFADYIQRVVAKLNAWSNAQQPQLRPPAAAAAVGHCPGAELLARLVASRRGQSIENLLRDIGCQFLSPPSTLVAMGDVDGTIIPTKGVPRVNTGGTNEKLFLIPTVLPSYLPSPNLAELLRRHRVDIRNFHAHAACDFNATSQVGGAAEPEKGTLSRSLQLSETATKGERQPKVPGGVLPMAMDEVDFPSGSHDVRNVSKHSRDCRQGVQPTSLHQQYRYLPPNLLPRPPACHSNGIFTDMPASNEFSPDSVTEGVAINMDDSACVSSQFCGSEIRSPNVSGDETSEYSGGRYTVAERGRNENENERGWGEAKAEHDESMAELILTALQRKDDLLREQANTLKQRDLELAHLQGEVAGLREEKRLLLQQLRDCNETDTASKQTASASREQQADITSLNAQNKKLITQLSEARREAEEREEKYTADLQYIHEEMQEFSTLVDEVRSLRAALQQMESNLAGERELRKKCELQYRESTREAEEVLIREREENQKKLKRYKKLYEEAEAAGREATNEAKLLQEELQQLTVNHATLTVTFEVNEQRIADMSEEQAHLRASLQAAREETVILRASLERLRNKEYLEAEDEENCEDETELTFHAHFHTEAERSMYGTRKQLESMVATLERRLSDSEGREQMLSAERERLRTQLQQLAVSARKELLEQQQIADERAAVQRVHIQQLQRELDEKQQQQEEAEERAQAALLRAQEQFREACSELQQVKEERATAAGEESRRHVLFEKQIAKVLQALQNKLSRRNVECRMLKQQIKLNEEQNRKRLETNVSEPVRQDRRPPVQNVKDGSRVTRPARLPLHNTVVKQEVLLAAAQPTALQEQRADARNARFTAPQSPACEYNCIEARLNEALARTTELEEQLQAKRRKYCAMVKDRKMLMERVEKQQQKQQWQIATLEDMQRETLRKLESTHRRRMSSAFAAAAEGNKRQQWVIQRGVARVVAELVEFIHELESYATVVGDRYVTRAASQNTKEKNHRVRLTYDSPLQDALSERENILRAACDDITRNFLGVNGGWEALCQSNSFTCSDISASFSFGKAIPQAMRQRVRCRIADYLKSQLLGTNSTRTGTGVTTTPGEMHKRSIGGGGNNKRTMNLSFGLHGEVEEERWLHGEPYAGAHGRSNRNLGTVPGSSSGESLIDVLMECVRYIFQA